MSLVYSTIENITKTHARLVETFGARKTFPLAYRRTQLLQLARLFQENADELMEAIKADLGRSKVEVTIPEMGPIVGGALRAAESLKEWNKEEKPKVEEWRSSWDTTVFKVPKGVVLIIGPWNYPYVTTLAPLIGAIAAGCPCIVKPSEMVPHSAQLLATLFPKYMDSSAYATINGAVPETTALLELKWAHIMFTGSTKVGKIVAAAALKNVTPVTLELGSKSPVYVDAENTDLDLAAKRILWGKQQNAGQVCVAPDYVLVPRVQQAALVASFKKAYAELFPFPKGSLDEKSEMGFLLTPQHHARMMDLIKTTQGQIALGGHTDGNRIEPTVVTDVLLDDSLMADELFGPLLPIVPVDSVEEAMKIINDRPTPLVIYVFTDSEGTKQKFLHSTQSGTLVLNDTFVQLGVYEMPFGGQGESGYGSYLGKYSFETFIHRRSYINVPPSAEPFLQGRYPPYSQEAYEFFSGPANLPIPEA
ncbi:Aldehyde/histidinol dehydrogenase [Mycena floridula]|nr:Aldehyde/histidinol dehydrogenase [Mycena floridula]